MTISENKTECCGCGACAAVCPADCIVMVRDDAGFLYPEIDASRCVDCGKCKRVCPVLEWKNKKNEPVEYDTFAAYSLLEDVRMNSSSGGLFAELAKEIISSGGAVYGSVYENVSSVRCVRAVDEAGTVAMRGAKYVESDMSDVFLQVKSDLKSGKNVLFGGTPCQTAALKSFVGEHGDRLFTVGCVCNSVASPRVLAEYVAEIERRKQKKAVSLTFRDKSTGWAGYASSFSVTFDDGEIYRESDGECLFKTAFVNRVITRPVCSVCPFRKYERAADLTLGDFWEIEKTYPNFYEPTGTSLVIVSGEKGAELLARISDSVVLNKAELSVAVRNNPSFCIQTPPHVSRSMFWAEFGKRGVTELIRDCFAPSLKNRIKRQFYAKTEKK